MVLCAKSCAFIDVSVTPPPAAAIGAASTATTPPASTSASAINQTRRTTTTMLPVGGRFLATEDGAGTSRAAATAAVPSPPNLAFSYGLFKYTSQPDPTGTECTLYTSSDTVNVNVWLTTAQIAMVVAFGCSSLATLFLALEYCCCRVHCSRVVINLGYLTAIAALPLTFLAFFDGQCQIGMAQLDGITAPVGGTTPGGGTLTCSMGEGAGAALWAIGMVLGALTVTCASPKPVPVIRVLEKMTKRSMDGNCCAVLLCGEGRGRRRRQKRRRQQQQQHQRQQQGRRKTTAMGGGPTYPYPPPASPYIYQDGAGGGTGPGPAQQQDGQNGAADADDDEDVRDSLGHNFKQYHDEGAGYTLQNQYVGAYRRWMECEADYDHGLDRFKAECLDAGVPWRAYLRTGRRLRRSQLQQQQRQKQQQLRQDQSSSLSSTWPKRKQKGHRKRAPADEDLAVDGGGALEEHRDLLGSFKAREESEEAVYDYFGDEDLDYDDADENDEEDEWKDENDNYDDDDDDDEIELDDQLMRSIDVLTNLRANCEFAEQVMYRIQQSIRDLTTLEDERRYQREALALNGPAVAGATARTIS
jgi:hypothetical protein